MESPTDPERRPEGPNALGSLPALGAALALLAVALGAFGAHGLSERLSADMLKVFEVGVRYQMYHSLALLALVGIVTTTGARRLKRVGWCWTLGVLIFSGSLYLLALSGSTWLGAVTPIGGVLMITGWALLLGALIRR